jgi:AcrR family transcriptional regulator
MESWDGVIGIAWFKKVQSEYMDNRELIMECAKDLFYAKGYDSVGVKEIVDSAGISKPTLYYYFGSKIGLLRTLLETKFDGSYLFAHETWTIEGDIRSVLHQVAWDFCLFFERDRKFYLLVMALFYSARENEAYEAVKPFVTDFYEHIVDIFDHFDQQLGNMNGRQRQFAIGFIGTINHFFLLQCEVPDEHQTKISEAQVVSLVNQYMYGIFT